MLRVGNSSPDLLGYIPSHVGKALDAVDAIAGDIRSRRVDRVFEPLVHGLPGNFLHRLTFDNPTTQFPLVVLCFEIYNVPVFAPFHKCLVSYQLRHFKVAVLITSLRAVGAGSSVPVAVEHVFGFGFAVTFAHPRTIPKS